MTRFPLIFTTVFSSLSVILCGYIVAVLVKHADKRFYHLWNKVAAILFGCLFLNNVFRTSLQIRDMASGHAPISDAMCYTTFAINEFLSSAVEIFYIIFLLIISVPKFAEPVTKAGIEWAVVPCVSVALGWACLATSIPLFVGTPLNHRRAWCWVDQEKAAIKFIFIYVTAAVSVLVAGGFVLWVVDRDVRVRKWRILTFGITQLLVVAIYAIFVFTEVASPIPANSPAFDAFGIWMAMHDSIRAITFIVAEKLYPPSTFFPDLWKCGDTTTIDDNNNNRNQTLISNNNNNNRISPGGSALELTPSETERRARRYQEQQQQQNNENTNLLYDEGGQHNNNNNVESDDDQLIANNNNNSKHMNMSRNQRNQYPSNVTMNGQNPTNNSSFYGNMIGAGVHPGTLMNSIEEINEGDTLTYFVRVLQRNSVAVGGGFFSDNNSNNNGGNSGGASGAAGGGGRRRRRRKNNNKNRGGYGTSGGGDGYDQYNGEGIEDDYDDDDYDDEDDSAYDCGTGVESSEDDASAYAGGRGASFMRFGSHATSTGGGGGYYPQQQQQNRSSYHHQDHLGDHHDDNHHQQHQHQDAEY